MHIHRTEKMQAHGGRSLPKISFKVRFELMMASVAFSATVLLTGCGMGVPGASGPTPVPVAAGAQGVVMGGQQPVAGVSLRLYQSGTSGYGTGSVVASSVFQTTAAGNFNLPAFSCTSGTQIYIVGTGGTPINGSPNANLALMVGLGLCDSFNPSRFININEITTVATVWALAPFMSSATSIGAPSSNSAGLRNAAALINEVVDTTTGKTTGAALPTGATLPVSEINALGNILQNCVNSAGGSASDSTDGQTTGTPCGKLFYNTKVGSTAPTDTITASLNMAKYPSQNVAKLNLLQSSSPAFQPTLSVNAPPSAWTIAINYVGGGLSSPTFVAIDGSSNVWVANAAGSSVSKFNAAGGAISPAAGYAAGTNPAALAIDPSGNVWVVNKGANSITKLNASGSTTGTFTGNGLSSPSALTIDGTGNVFVTNTSSVSGFNNSGSALSGSPFTGVAAPLAVAATPR